MIRSGVTSADEREAGKNWLLRAGSVLVSTHIRARRVVAQDSLM